MAEQSGPYRVQRVESPKGAAWRLTGPGLEDGKAYPYDEFREKLEEIARLMNFAWRQSEMERLED